MSGYITRGSLVEIWKGQERKCHTCGTFLPFRVMSASLDGKHAVCQSCLTGVDNPTRTRGDGQTIVTNLPIGYDVASEKSAIVAKQAQTRKVKTGNGTFAGTVKIAGSKGAVKSKAQKYHASADYIPANPDENSPVLNMGQPYADTK